jgi:serine/threonine protein kinase
MIAGQMEPVAGARVTPNVRLVRKLGAGGMGAVWVAEHEALHTQVAVKFMSRELAARPDLRARFSREAASASAVKSPHVVQMLDHGVTEQGLPFLVMELLDGEDLAERLRREGPMPAAVVDAVLTQVCKALSRAHEAGIVHRDLKPENIFLTRQDDDEIFCKLLDFGIAKGSDELSGHTQSGVVMGTTHYMSPEQLVAAKNVDHRSDLWAMGIVVFELLTGRRPYAGDSAGALAIAVHNTTPQPPTALRPDLPPAVDAWFARACAKASSDRFATAKEMARAFSVAIGRDERTLVGFGSSASGVERSGGFRPVSDAGAEVRAISGDEPTAVAQSAPVSVTGAPIEPPAKADTIEPQSRSRAASTPTPRERRPARYALAALAALLIAASGVALLRRDGESNPAEARASAAPPTSASTAQASSMSAAISASSVDVGAAALPPIGAAASSSSAPTANASAPPAIAPSASAPTPSASHVLRKPPHVVRPLGSTHRPPGSDEPAIQ